MQMKKQNFEDTRITRKEKRHLKHSDVPNELLEANNPN